MTLPKSMDEEAVARWAASIDAGCPMPVGALCDSYRDLARAVLALVEAKCREAVRLTRLEERGGNWTDDDAIVSSVMGRDTPREAKGGGE